MKIIRSVLRDHIDGTAGGAAIPGVVSVSHHVDFLNRIQRGRNVPGSSSLIAITNLLRDVRSVESELIKSTGVACVVLSRGVDSTTHDVRVVVVPPSTLRTTRVLAARRGADEVVNLAAGDGHVLQGALIEDGSA